LINNNYLFNKKRNSNLFKHPQNLLNILNIIQERTENKKMFLNKMFRRSIGNI